MKGGSFSFPFSLTEMYEDCTWANYRVFWLHHHNKEYFMIEREKINSHSQNTVI